MSESNEVVRFNVGGRIFPTTIDTLSRVEPENMLLSMAKKTIPSTVVDGGLFIDRSPLIFDSLIEYLRTGTVPDPFTASIRSDADFYGFVKLLSAVDSAPPPAKRRKAFTEYDCCVPRSSSDLKLNDSEIRLFVAVDILYENSRVNMIGFMEMAERLKNMFNVQVVATTDAVAIKMTSSKDHNAKAYLVLPPRSGSANTVTWNLHRTRPNNEAQIVTFEDVEKTVTYYIKRWLNGESG